MKTIRVLGSGCPKCRKLYDEVVAAVKESGTDADVEKVEDINEILRFGVMMTPALVVDGEVKVMRRVPRPDELKSFVEACTPWHGCGSVDCGLLRRPGAVVLRRQSD